MSMSSTWRAILRMSLRDPFAVMMTIPSDLDDFAVGFSLTEGVIQKAEDIRSIRVEREEQGLRLAIDLTSDRLHAHLARRRALSGRTGCGLCGIDDLDALPQARFRNGPAPRVSLGAIRAALGALDREQVLNGRTRAVHGAAWADGNGTLVYVREDVGRHNALDKLIGALCRRGTQPDSGFVIVTSRCSFELVEKVAATNTNILVYGESGTGKELVARAIHALSSRRGKVFIPFNCTAVPKELSEGYLFGTELVILSGRRTVIIQ